MLFRSVFGKQNEKQNSWGVYRNGFLIPEFTIDEKGDWAESENDARQKLLARKDIVEKLIPLKYELPSRFFAHHEFFALMLIEGPVHDLIFFMPAEAVLKTLHPHKTDFIWFPTTRLAYTELFYGPTYSPDYFTRILPEKSDWINNESAHREFYDLLARSG